MKLTVGVSEIDDVVINEEINGQMLENTFCALVKRLKSSISST